MSSLLSHEATIDTGIVVGEDGLAARGISVCSMALCRAKEKALFVLGRGVGGA